MYKQIIKQFEHALALKYLSIILVNKLLSLMDMGRGRDVRLATTRKKTEERRGVKCEEGTQEEKRRSPRAEETRIRIPAAPKNDRGDTHGR
jgi:hypothetical protein